VVEAQSEAGVSTRAGEAGAGMISE
jgi:hypothetical protein